MPHKYNKNYFQYTGRSRPILLLFEIAEEEHNRKSNPEEWKATKIEVLSKRFKVDELSTLNINGKVISRGSEMFSYVADSLSLSGNSEGEKAQTHDLINNFNTLFNRMGEIRFNKKYDAGDRKKACARILGESPVQRTFNSIVQQLLDNGNQFYFGEKITAPDVYFIFTIKFIQTMFPKVLAPYRGLEAYIKRISDIECIKSEF